MCSDTLIGGYLLENSSQFASKSWVLQPIVPSEFIIASLLSLAHHQSYNSREFILVRTTLQIASKAEHCNVSFVLSLYLLSVTSGTIHVRGALYIFIYLNFYARPLSSQTSTVRESNEVASSMLCSKRSNNHLKNTLLLACLQLCLNKKANQWSSTPLLSWFLLATSQPYTTCWKGSYISAESPSRSMCRSSRTCPTNQSSIDRSTAVTYFRNYHCFIEINALFTDVGVHIIINHLYIPIQTFLSIPILNKPFYNIASSKDQLSR